MIKWSHGLLVMLAVTLVQVTLFDVWLIVGKYRIDLPLYLLVALGLSTQISQAAMAGFALGIIVDLFQFGPFGLNGLTYCIAAWALAEARSRVIQDETFLRTMRGVGATLSVTGLTWLLGLVFGQKPLALSQGAWGVPRNLLVVGAIGGVAVHLMRTVANWITEEPWYARTPETQGL